MLRDLYDGEYDPMYFSVDTKDAKKYAEECRQKADSDRTAYNDEQAGVLAEKLEEGMPCPVCGSVHHPAKAHKSAHAPDEAAVKRSEKAARESLVMIPNCPTIPISNCAPQ